MLALSSAKRVPQQALRMLFHIEGATFFKKGQLRDSLKQPNLEQNRC